MKIPSTHITEGYNFQGTFRQNLFLIFCCLKKAISTIPWRNSASKCKVNGNWFFARGPSIKQPLKTLKMTVMDEKYASPTFYTTTVKKPWIESRVHTYYKSHLSIYHGSDNISVIFTFPVHSAMPKQAHPVLACL